MDPVQCPLDIRQAVGDISVLGNRLGAWIPERPLQFAAAGVMVLVAIALISGLLG